MSTTAAKRYVIDEEQMKKVTVNKATGKVMSLGVPVEEEVSMSNPSVGLSSGSSVGLEGPEKQMHILKPYDNRSRIICVSDAIHVEYNLEYDEDYKDLMEDITLAGLRFGNLVNVVIPRPDPDHPARITPGVGKAFLEYEDLDGASRAESGFNLMKRDYGIQLTAAYYPEDKFAQGDLDG